MDCSEQNRLSYVKQRNYCVSLLRKTKKDYYANLNVKDIVDNKQFWRTVKPLFSDKTKSNEKITLVEDETVTTHEQNAELLNLFFKSFFFFLNLLNLFFTELSPCKHFTSNFQNF